MPGWPCDRDGESRGTVGELIVVGADFCIGCIGLTWAELILGSSADSQWLVLARKLLTSQLELAR